MHFLHLLRSQVNGRPYSFLSILDIAAWLLFIHVPHLFLGLIGKEQKTARSGDANHLPDCPWLCLGRS